MIPALVPSPSWRSSFALQHLSLQLVPPTLTICVKALSIYTFDNTATYALQNTRETVSSTDMSSEMQGKQAFAAAMLSLLELPPFASLIMIGWCHIFSYNL
jgi:hypothetical protein